MRTRRWPKKIEIVLTVKNDRIGDPTNDNVSIYYQAEEEYQEGWSVACGCTYIQKASRRRTPRIKKQ